MTSTTKLPKTRERLLDAALDLFAEEGFRGTTITAVEARAGLAAGTGSFYRHFASKEELLSAAVGREVERCRAEILESRGLVPGANGPAEPPPATLEQALRDIRRFDRLLRLALTDGERVPEVREAISAALAGSGEMLSWDASPQVVVALAALGGYHVMSQVQGRPFQGVPEEEFLAKVAELLGLEPDT